MKTPKVLGLVIGMIASLTASAQEHRTHCPDPERFKAREGAKNREVLRPITKSDLVEYKEPQTVRPITDEDLKAARNKTEGDFVEYDGFRVEYRSTKPVQPIQSRPHTSSREYSGGNRPDFGGGSTSNGAGRSPASHSEVWTESDGHKGTTNHFHQDDKGRVTTERHYPDGRVERNGVTIREGNGGGSKGSGSSGSEARGGGNGGGGSKGGNGGGSNSAGGTNVGGYRESGSQSAGNRF